MNHYREDTSERSSSPQDTNTQHNYSSLDRHGHSGASTSNAAHLSSSDYYYLRNQLQNYSFGTAPRLSNSPTTNPVAAQDDPELEEILYPADITPRPSVVAYEHQSLPRTSAFSRSPRNNTTRAIGTTVNDPNIGRRNIDSIPSSASASVTSFSESLYTGSVLTLDSSSAPRTPSNDYMFSDDEHGHPFYINASEPYPSSSTNISTTSMEFSSEEEYESDEPPDIEISSVRMASVDMSFQEEEYPADEISYTEMDYSQGRRGSLPMAIPGSSATPATTTHYTFGRDRDQDFISLRRPSRSLDDDLNVTDAMRSLSIISRTADDPSPVSVPGCEGDWRNLTARARQRGSIVIEINEEPEFPPSLGSRSYQAQPSTSDVNSVGEFDLAWDNLAQGIVSFDQSEIADIVRLPGGTNMAHTAAGSRWFPRFGNRNNLSAEHARRPSIATITSVGSDTFGRAIFRWGGEEYQAQRQDWTFKRERASIVQQVPNVSGSGNAGSRGLAGFLGSKTPEEERKKAQKEREKARVLTFWKGMPIDSHEIWRMSVIGKFKVERRATKTVDIAKGPQQRIIVHHLRDADNNLTSVTAGPTSTVHKHSKAVAFSIGRFHRKKNEHRDKLREIGSGPLITASHPPAPSPDSQKRPGGMILLAPRRVQVAFTNTTSTRKLESHGLLDEDRPRKVKKEYDPIKYEREREKKEMDKRKQKDRGKQKEGGKEKQREGGKEKQKKREESKGKERATDLLQPETTASTSSARPLASTDMTRTANVSSGSDTYQTPSVAASTTVVGPSIPSTPLLSPSMNLSTSQTEVFKSDTLNRSIVPITPNLPDGNRPRRRRRRVHDPLDLDEDEDDYEHENHGRYSPPTRTPYSETYGTVDASLIEQLNLERAQNELETGSVFKRLFRSRNNRTVIGPATGHLEANYEPPWIVLPSRSKQEQQQRVVENLNSSFMDVGLLPSSHKSKNRSKSVLGKKRDDQTTGFLSEVPEDSLYMLLPLWPGETDPISTQNHLHLVKRIPPSDHRQYVLIFYQPQNPKKGDKKKRPSPFIEGDLTDRSILLTSFHISARFVAHNDLIGTGIRVPDEGLTISGPLDYAWDTLPSAEAREDRKTDWVIGMCNSREAGIEFIPEGLVKMDLCRMSWKPPSAVSDNYVPPEPSLHLTPIGRSVVEMAWLGAVALTSFGRVGQV
ncbi:hypothetical protein AX15_003251 [Amanita polypyramis BW_CC]|nr:hypothetical protein AX15_003251 [Amanita polypyramis BW_CC]